jgi:hypothetical protein
MLQELQSHIVALAAAAAKELTVVAARGIDANSASVAAISSQGGRRPPAAGPAGPAAVPARLPWGLCGPCVGP